MGGRGGVTRCMLHEPRALGLAWVALWRALRPWLRSWGSRRSCVRFSIAPRSVSVGVLRLRVHGVQGAGEGSVEGPDFA